MAWIKDRVASVDMMREMDRKAIEEYKVPGIILMENAGRGAFEMIMEEEAPEKVSVFCGKGNNGGDGCVIARHLMNSGVEVDLYLLARKEDIKGDARANLDILINMRAPVLEALDYAALEDYRYHIRHSDLLVDAILGTGIDKPVEGFYAQAIGFINAMARERPGMRVFAVDIPSGINADTGQVMGAAVEADSTATFGAIKTGQLSFPGAAMTGALALVDISLPAELYEKVPHRIITRDLATALLPGRPEDAHKGTTGHAIVLAGSPGKTGAAVMAAYSALRAGAGLVTLAGPGSLHQVLEAKTTEVMTEPLPDTDRGMLAQVSIERALTLMEDKTAAALGPGIGGGEGPSEFVKEIIKQSPIPLVIDADGLNAIAGDPSMLDDAKAPMVLTPHPGEMSRLAGVGTKEVLADRLRVCKEFAEKHKVVLVLKGAHSLVVTPEGNAYYNLTGNPGMASGGTGDVLTGVITGLVCQGLSAEAAAVLGVYLHGLAGDVAAKEQGEEGLVAGDVIKAVPEALIRIKNRTRPVAFDKEEGNGRGA